jgi:hypothetical protein
MALRVPQRGQKKSGIALIHDSHNTPRNILGGRTLQLLYWGSGQEGKDGKSPCGEDRLFRWIQRSILDPTVLGWNERQCIPSADEQEPMAGSS